MPETGLHTARLGKTASSRPILRGAEWLAENAYNAPGFHRLFTVLGLTAGLWSGRQLMNIIIGYDAKQEKDITIEQVPVILRPLHGIMSYNRYSDAPEDRWKSVLDAVGPAVIGAFGAYLGSRHFFEGNLRGKAVHGISASVRKQLEASGGKMTLDVADSLMSAQQSKATSKLAASTFVIGSSAGSHLAGSFNPFSNGMIATRFQQGNLRNISLPLPRIISAPIERFLGNFGHSSKRLTPAIREWVKWAESNIVHNKTTDWRAEHEIIARANDFLQVFPNLTKAEKQAFYKESEKLLDTITRHMETLQREGKSVGDIEKAIHQFAADRITGTGLETLYRSAGIDITKAQTPDFGPFTAISRLLGSGKTESETLKKLHQHWSKEFGINTSALSTIPATRSLSSATAMGAAGLTLLGGAGVALSARKDHADRDQLRQQLRGQDNKHEHSRYDDLINKIDDKKEDNNIVNWLNGKPLDIMQWASRVLILPPSLHRFMSAAYFSGGLWGGMKVANILTGRQLPLIRAGANAASLLSKEHLSHWNPLRAAHGLLHYTPGLSTTQDRWRQALHHIIPVAVGAGTTYMGSKHFFSNRESAVKNPEYLEDYTDTISYQQSRPYGWLIAFTSIFSASSGIHLLPVFNYSASLQNRYVLGDGKQVALPVVGKWWSGNPGILPWGTKRTLNYTINYLTHNPDEHPRELPELARTLIAKLYPSLTPNEVAEKERALIDKIYEVRDPFLHEHRIQNEAKPELKKALAAALTKEGLEHTLTSIGLDVTKADLDNNGLSGKIADILGEAKKVKSLEDTYHIKAKERLQRNTTPSSIRPDEGIKPTGKQGFRAHLNETRNADVSTAQPTSAAPVAR
jgi:hypothetical protein